MGFWLKKVRFVVKKNPNKIPIFVGGTGLYLDGLNGQVSPIPDIPKKIIESVEQIKKKKEILIYIINSSSLTMITR